MPAGGWKNVALPEPVVDRIDRALRGDGTYRSRGEFVKNAVLRALEAAEAPRGVA